jgi:tRNA A37 threonylcarbamoyladenosine dehydratase
VLNAQHIDSGSQTIQLPKAALRDRPCSVTSVPFYFQATGTEATTSNDRFQFVSIRVIRGPASAFRIESLGAESYPAGVTKNYEARFGGIRRLFGADGQDRLSRAHVCVVGLGGVGSWAIEALARTGLGALTLVDFDEICISNVNRQLHAVTGEFGKPKVAVLAERARLIQPDCDVHPLQTQFTASTAAEILAPRFDGVLDAIDRPALKALLIAGCRERGIPVASAGGAGGRRDPTQIRVEDLARVSHDRLLRVTRNMLREEHDFPRGVKRKFGVRCVYSPEAQVFPARDGSVCETPEPDADLRLDCRSGYGTACFVTGAFGFAAAAEIVRIIVGSVRQS